MLASDPDRKPRPEQVECPDCGATARACDGVRWLRGRSCCQSCDGTHPEVR